MTIIPIIPILSILTALQIRKKQLIPEIGLEWQAQEHAKAEEAEP